MSWPETDLAYLAGFIDGEGSITIFSSQARGRRRDNLRFDIYNTDETVLLWIMQVFGGRVHTIPRSRRDWKQEHVWTAGPRQAACILTACLPYLKLKKRQAELFIQHQATSHRNGRNRTPPDVLAVRDRIIAEVQGLNRKGAIDPALKNYPADHPMKGDLGSVPL